ncbi:MAG: RelA/SpoT family protein [candidate division KSB1 bacterium]|nr:RelA/SpoT family protein [candidate division KSB1 bacterium]
MNIANVTIKNSPYASVVEGLMRRIKRYNENANMEQLSEAFDFSYGAHSDQTRQSGHPYFEHPLEVVKILVEHHMDYQTIIGGLLHDVVEDTKIDIDQVEKKFDSQIALLVDGVTKISGLKLPEFETRQNENFRKMLLSMVKDIRVIMIKFADRLHNMRTLGVLEEDKRKRIARETRELYAPLAHRLGLARIKSELEDLALKYLHPEFYDDISRRINETKKEREEELRNVTRVLRKDIVAAKIHARFEGRAKHFYSIYNKIINRGVPFENIHDLLAVRIIVNRIDECYHALGIVHSMFTPIHERFKDYISTPKSNGYQSIHTIVVGPMGKKYEVQIRTEDMHRTAEEGIAAHWHYKEGRFEEDDLDKNLVWLRQILDTDEDDPDASFFMENLKINLFQDEVFVFTPKGDLHRLPVNSTPVDFAFYVHTEVGMHCMAAKVNGKIVPLSKKLNNGDSVEVLTSSNKFPNKDWLQFTVTSKARSKIRKYIRDLEFKNSVSGRRNARQTSEQSRETH